MKLFFQYMYAIAGGTACFGIGLAFAKGNIGLSIAFVFLFLWNGEKARQFAILNNKKT